MSWPTNRRSYRGLMMLPAWLLFDGEQLVASVRAASADDARVLFKKAKLEGTHMRRAPS
jgi:hypothetical protein